MQRRDNPTDALGREYRIKRTAFGLLVRVYQGRHYVRELSHDGVPFSTVKNCLRAIEREQATASATVCSGFIELSRDNLIGPS